MIYRSTILWRVAVALALLAPMAQAEGNSAVAEALFDDGQRLSGEGKFDQACLKFAESQRLDPGIGTLLNLAKCYEDAGRTATAWATWREAASAARSQGQADREELARDRAQALEGKLAKITLSVFEAERPAGLVVTQNGVEQSSASWGTALPVDAGRLTIEANAPGYLSWSREVEIVDGAMSEVDVPPLQPDKNYVAGALAVAPSEAATPVDEDQAEPDAPSSEPPAEKAGSNSQKIWGFSLIGLGAAGVGVGAYFGMDAVSKNDDSLALCRSEDPTQCTSGGAELRSQALTSATISSIAIGVGVAAAVSGVVLVITAPSAKTQVGMSPLPGGARISLGGKF